ncbi:MAG TPA: flagellar biosynthetic protein FliR [Polyangiaceae bacterium]|nr:flagellar biosynthetic protein FliR [Polyangiaceae bacterium]
MSPLARILSTELSLFALACGRIAGIVAIAPLAWAHAPNRIKVTLVLLLGIVAHGQHLRAPLPESPLLIGSALVVELGIGLLIGLVVRFTVAIAEICGETISPAIGLGMASAFDPATQSHGTQISSILRHFMVLTALIIGIHRIVLSGLLVGFRTLPVGTASNLALGLPDLVALSSNAISAGVRIALPLIAILYMTQIALAFIARAAPQMQVFNVGFAVMLAVGLSVFALLLPDIAQAFITELSHVETHLESLLLTLGARP